MTGCCTSVKYIQMSETHTTPYISMKALERMPVRSISAPNMMGSTNRPCRPADDAADGSDVLGSRR